MANKVAILRGLAILALLVSIATLVLLACAGPGTRFGLWSFRTGLGLLRYVAYGAIAGSALGLVALLGAGSRIPAALAMILGLSALSVPLGFRHRAASVPMIHDISTDTEDAPKFEAVLVQRTAASNPAEYGGAEIAQQQRQAYPDLVPIIVSEAPARAFERAIDIVRELGWDLVAADRARGHIEATDTTFWFGFKDDVVIRIRAEGSGSRIDVRSLSRVGKSDVGTNARRIRTFRNRMLSRR
jgi:uncharacterized protein (DUF1499 family)